MNIHKHLLNEWTFLGIFITLLLIGIWIYYSYHKEKNRILQIYKETNKTTKSINEEIKISKKENFLNFGHKVTKLISVEFTFLLIVLVLSYDAGFTIVDFFHITNTHFINSGLLTILFMIICGFVSKALYMRLYDLFHKSYLKVCPNNKVRDRLNKGYNNTRELESQSITNMYITAIMTFTLLTTFISIVCFVWPDNYINEILDAAGASGVTNFYLPMKWAALILGRDIWFDTNSLEEIKIRYIEAFKALISRNNLVCCFLMSLGMIEIILFKSEVKEAFDQIVYGVGWASVILTVSGSILLSKSIKLGK